MLRVQKDAGVRVRWTASVVFKKYDSAQGLSFGYASFIVDKSGAPIVDHDEDIIEESELEPAAYRWVENSRVIGEQHSKRGVGNVVECAYMNPEKRRAMGGFDESDLSAGMWLGVRWTDPDTRAKAARGEIKEWSIAGWAKRIPVGKGNIGRLVELELDEISGVDRGAGIGVGHAMKKSQKEDSMLLGQLITKALAFVPAEKRAELEKKLKGVDFAKLASMDDIKAKLTAEEWDLIMAHLVPASPEEEAAEGEGADGSMPPAPAAKGKKGAKKKAASDNAGDDDGDPVAKAHALELAALKKEIAEQREEVKLEKYRREVAESPVLKFYPASTADTARLLKEADDRKDKPAREAMIRSAKAIKESSLMKSHGSSRPGAANNPGDEGGEGEGTATQKLMKLANERMEKSEGKSNFYDAIEVIAKANPQLYAEYVHERRMAGGARG